MNSPLLRSLKLSPPSFGPASETGNAWITILRSVSRRCYSIRYGRTTRPPPCHGTHAHSIHEVYTVFLASGPSYRQLKRSYRCHSPLLSTPNYALHTYSRSEVSEYRTGSFDSVVFCLYHPDQPKGGVVDDVEKNRANETRGRLGDGDTCARAVVLTSMTSRPDGIVT